MSVVPVRGTHLIEESVVRRRRNTAVRRRRGRALLAHLLAAAAEANPTGVAVVDDRGSMTYGELDAWSSQVARLLIARGVGAEDVVAIGIPRSVRSVAALWAVAKSGAAFVPVDPGYPAARVSHMVADSGATLGLTVESSLPQLPGTVPWLSLDAASFETEVAAFPAEAVSYLDRVRPLREAHPAYVIYTSGSTGLPKGVTITHTGLGNFCDEQRDRYQVNAQSRTLHFASPSFDASVLELLLAVGAGATMVIAPADIYGGPELAELLRRERVTHAFVTPAALASIDQAGLDELGTIVVGGEACPSELVHRWAVDIGGRRRRFFNGYGPTETTIMTNISDALSPGDPVTIGPAIRGTTTQILDSRLRPTPVGVAGELYLAGPGVARGYCGKPGLTAARFVADPSGPPGSRTYRSGDLASRSLPDGPVHHMGRNDCQVKIRGFRIELGEIDAVLGAHPGVEFAVTVGREISPGVTSLVGYVRVAASTVVDPTELRGFAAELLPQHLVPATVVLLDEIPLTPSGKVDRAALPEPPMALREFRAPVSATEQVVSAAFGELFGAEQIGLDDDFFQLGGNSLSAIRVSARIGSELGVRVPPRLLFEASTPAALAEQVDRQATSARLPLVRGRRPDRVPLSSAQQRMWLTNRYDPSSPMYNVPFALRLTGALDIGALWAALRDVVERHEPLRTVYPDSVDGPFQQLLSVEQVVRPQVPQRVSAAQHGLRLRAAAAAGFDLTTEPPLRVELCRIADQDHLLILILHHIACDGTSLAPLSRDITVAYLARSVGAAAQWRPLPVDYSDYVWWQRELLGEETNQHSAAARQTEFWTKQLSDAPELLNLPADRSRPARPSGGGGRVEFELGSETAAGLRRIAQEHNATLFMVVHAALAVLLARMSGSADICIGTQIAGRSDEALDDLVGMFGNTLVLRTDVQLAEPFSRFVDRVRGVDIAAYDNADLAFDRVVELLRPGHPPAYAPLFQVLLMLQNFEQPRAELTGLDITGVGIETNAAKLDLSVTLAESAGAAGEPNGIRGEIVYATDLFDADTAESYARRYAAILEAVGRDESVPVGDLPILSHAERAALAIAVDPIGSDRSDTLVDLFDAQVARTPEAVALVFDAEQWTYRDFDIRVNRLARWLIGAGVAPDVLVGVAVRRSPAMLVGIYAVLKAGGGYVPIDPDHPAARIGYVLDNSALALVLTFSGVDLTVPDRCPRIDVDTVDTTALSGAPVSDDDRAAPLRPADAAYVIYTSGSTGRPKGVVVSHRSVVNQMSWMCAQYGLGPTDAVLQKTPVTFDASIWELFLPLQIGARLVIAEPGGHLDPDYLLSTARQHAIGIMEFVPSMLAVLVADESAELPSTLRFLSVGGEELPAALLDRVHARHRVTVDNTYGPTEATVTSTVYRTVPGQPGAVPIGAPVPDTGVRVLDPRGHQVPSGVAGELYLTGVQLARGYHRRSAATAERFVADPFGAPGTRMYRTGDLVRTRPDGNLEFLGRTDFQVQLRGLRIELGEIEAALAAHPSVSQAVVAIGHDHQVGDFLAAYVVAAEQDADSSRPDPGIDSTELTAHLTRSLPAYMVPKHIVVLAEFPLTASGKLDRRALPAIDIRSSASAYQAPSTPIEQAVGDVFAELLGVARIGLADDFFDLGGNSLVGMRVIARLNALLGAELGVAALFEAPTVAALAQRLSAAVAAVDPMGRAVAVPLVARERPERIPLSYAQQRYWFLNQFDITSAVENLPFALRLSGEVDVAALGAALTDVIARHESLRTVYPADEHGPHQVEIWSPTTDSPGVVKLVSIATRMLFHAARAQSSMPCSAGPYQSSCARMILSR